MTKVADAHVRANITISVTIAQATGYPNGPLLHAVLQNQTQAVPGLLMNCKTIKQLEG